MAKVQGLTDARLRGFLEPGKHHDGKGTGLYLVVRESGSRAWAQRLRVPGGKVREIGHGTYPEVGIGEARRRAEAAQEQVRTGADPVVARQGAKVAAAVAQERTLRAALAGYLAAHSGAWKNAKTEPVFRASIEKHAAALIDRPVAGISLEDVRDTLSSIWTTTPVLAQKVRGRLEAVFEFAAAARWMSGANPAAWKGGLRPLLAKPSTLHTTRHHPALPWRRVPAFLTALRQQPGVAATCLHLCILTACRSGEARGADWSEIDLQAGVWKISAARMKARAAHRIPLAPAAIALLTSQLPDDGNKPARGLVFPNPKGAPYSDMSLLAVVLRMQDLATKRGGLGWVDEDKTRITPHGFRTSFRSWCGDHAVPRELAEMSLAHKIGSAVEQAYARTDLLDRRREVIDRWCAFIEAAPSKQSMRSLPHVNQRKSNAGLPGSRDI